MKKYNKRSFLFVIENKRSIYETQGAWTREGNEENNENFKIGFLDFVYVEIRCQREENLKKKTNVPVFHSDQYSVSLYKDNPIGLYSSVDMTAFR